MDALVSDFMSSPVHAVELDAKLPLVQHRLASLGLSSLAVVDGQRLAGVVSRSDLIEVGRRESGERGGAVLLSLPDRPVSEVMASEAITMAPGDPIASAARAMVERSVHRVYVVSGERLLGVLSTFDLMVAIRDRKATAPISDLMTSPVVTVGAGEPIAAATGRLGEAHVSGLVVVEDDWPVGLFTQTEALECRDLAGDTPIDEVMNPGMICMPEDTKIHRAAQQAIAMGARRIICVRAREMVGIVGGLDFARFAARPA